MHTSYEGAQGRPFYASHLKQNYPKSRDVELGTIQSALLSATGLLTCLWADIINNDLQADEEAVVNVHNVLDIVQRTLMLMGKANELVSQAYVATFYVALMPLWKSTLLSHNQIVESSYLARVFVHS